MYTGVCVCVYIQVCVHCVCVCTHMHVHVCLCVSVCQCACVCQCVYVRMVHQGMYFDKNNNLMFYNKLFYVIKMLFLGNFVKLYLIL